MSVKVKFKSNHPQARDIYIFVSEKGLDYYLYVGEGTRVNIDPFFMDVIDNVAATVDYEIDNEGVRRITRIVSYKL